MQTLGYTTKSEGKEIYRFPKDYPVEEVTRICRGYAKNSGDSIFLTLHRDNGTSITNVYHPNGTWNTIDSLDKELNYCILQLKRCDENRYHGFASLDELKHLGLKVESSRYENMYQSQIIKDSSAAPNADYCEILYRRFNVERPEDFKGHSMSIGDIVLMWQHKEHVEAYFCDMFGFEKLDIDFREHIKDTEKTLEAEPSKTNKVTRKGLKL